jgi:hypothetical protein
MNLNRMLLLLLLRMEGGPLHIVGREERRLVQLRCCLDDGLPDASRPR